MVYPVLLYIVYLGLDASCNILIPGAGLWGGVGFWFFFFCHFQSSGYVWICGSGFRALSAAEYLNAIAEVKCWAGGVLQHCILALGTCRQVAVSNTANALLYGVFFEMKFCRFYGKT